MTGEPGPAAHSSLVREQFAGQAGSLSDPAHPFSDPGVMRWVVGHVQRGAEVEVLDVAGGAGHLARALAPGVGRVVVVDVTPEMLAAGRRDAAAQGVENVVFEPGDAAALPHPDGSFDVVVCRFAVHHFSEPERPLSEMVRVCRPGGEVVVVDVVVVDPALAEAHNRLERLRDPSHTAALTGSRMRELVAGAGANVVHEESREWYRDLEGWLAQTRTPARDADAIRRALREELAGGRATGMRPFVHDGRLGFTHSLRLLVART